MSKSLIERAMRNAKRLVLSMAESFRTPENRGSSFSWKRFPKMMDEMARAYAFSGFSNEEFDPHREMLEDVAGEMARAVAKKIARKELGGS